jgi:Skp family chaperone for outer membrane proteins
MAGVLALSLAIVASARLRAQQGTTQPPQPRPAAPTTKVAVMNLTYVVNNYDKFKGYKEEIKQAVKPFQEADEKYKTDAKKLADEAQKADTTQNRREQIEGLLKDLQRKVEDNKNEAQKVVGRKQEQQLYTLYLDVHTVCKRVAEARGYDMILHFNDATEAKEFWSAANIARKMQAGALMPIYYNPALDVSADVLNTLNAYHKSNSTPPKQ